SRQIGGSLGGALTRAAGGPAPHRPPRTRVVPARPARGLITAGCGGLGLVAGLGTSAARAPATAPRPAAPLLPDEPELPVAAHRATRWPASLGPGVAREGLPCRLHDGPARFQRTSSQQPAPSAPAGFSARAANRPRQVRRPGSAHEQPAAHAK